MNEGRAIGKRKGALASTLGLVLAAGLFAHASAADCGGAIDSFSREAGLAPSPPAGAGPEASQKDLSRSNGVIAPSRSAPGPGTVITPSTKDAMPTTPAIPQQTAQGPVKGSAPGADPGAARRVQMQALLDAAREAHTEGKEDQCLDDVSRARGLEQKGGS